MNMTLVIYTLFVLVEMILHLIRHFRYQKAEGETLMRAQKMDIRLTLLMDLLQLPLSLIFTRFLNLFSAVILVLGRHTQINLPEAMQAIADTVHKSVGFTKNCFDLFNICITITVGLVCQGHLIGIGLGTVVAVIGVGRVIAIFNHGFKKKMDDLAGMEDIDLQVKEAVKTQIQFKHNLIEIIKMRRCRKINEIFLHLFSIELFVWILF